MNKKLLLLPLSEGDAVNLHNAVLHQCLGSDQLIVAGIVHHIQYTTLAADSCKQDEICMFMSQVFTSLINWVSTCICTHQRGSMLPLIPFIQNI